MRKATVPRPQGYAVVSEPDGPGQEWDTLTCAHCQRVVFVGRDPGGFCRICSKPVCGTCADRGRCNPYERQLERAERRAALWRAMEEG